MKFLELRLHPPVVWLLCVLAALGIRVWRDAPLPAFVVVPGTVFMIIGMLTILFAGMQFKQHQTTIHPHKSEQASTLLTTGLFAFSRNPIYLGLAVLLAGVIIAGVRDVTALVMVPVFVLYIQRFQIVPEERLLQQVFGQQYSEYCQRTGRWLSLG